MNSKEKRIIFWVIAAVLAAFGIFGVPGDWIGRIVLILIAILIVVFS